MFFRKNCFTIGLSIVLAACGASESKYVVDFETYKKLVDDSQVESLIVVKGEKNGFAGLACLFMASMFTEEVLTKATEAKAKGVDLEPDDLQVDNPTAALFSLIDGNLKFEAFQDIPDMTNGGKLSFNLEDREGANFMVVDSNEVTCSYPLIRK